MSSRFILQEVISWVKRIPLKEYLNEMPIKNSIRKNFHHRCRNYSVQLKGIRMEREEKKIATGVVRLAMWLKGVGNAEVFAFPAVQVITKQRIVTITYSI